MEHNLTQPPANTTLNEIPSLFLVDIWRKAKEYLFENSLQIAAAIIIFIVGYILIKILSLILKKVFERTYYDPTVERFLQNAIKVFLWILLITIIFDNLGYNVTAFLAGMGVAGFIIGFAVKDVLANSAAGMMILLYKPFRVDDEVEITGIRGRVKEITMSFTILIVENTQYVVIPNGRVWGNPIKNFSKLLSPAEQKRRFLFPWRKKEESKRTEKNSSPKNHKTT